MSTKVIPEKRIFICDRCLKEDRPRRSNSVFAIKGAALDWSGAAVADGSQQWELCDQCAYYLGCLITKDIKALHP